MTKQAWLLHWPFSLIIIATLLAGCDENNGAHNSTAVPHVTVHTIKSAPLKITTELPGRTSAFRVAEVRPQVSGIILKRNFTEGSDITAGESLYQIDPATYQAAWQSAKGELAKAQAAAAIARLTVKRYAPLAGTQYISKQEYDQALANANQAEASVKAALAAVKTAEINLAYRSRHRSGSGAKQVAAGHAITAAGGAAAGDQRGESEQQLSAGGRFYNQ